MQVLCIGAFLSLLAVLGVFSSSTLSADCPVVEFGDNLYKQLSEPGTSIGKYIVYLGNFTSSHDCANACQKQSTPSEPCHSWTYYFSNYTGGQGDKFDLEKPSGFATQCFGRYDDYWNPNFVFHGWLTSGVNCNYPPSTLVPSPGPPSVHFSWDTIPVFYHSSNYSGPYNDDAIKLMAKFPLVTIEKFQGNESGYKYPTNPYKCCEEDRIVETLSRVKAVNPNVSGIFYYNMVLDFPQYRLHEEFSKNESWWLHTSDGQVVRVSGGTHAHPDLLVYDTTQEAVADLFINTCINLTTTGAVDGCFVDRVVDGLPINDMTAEKNVEMQVTHLTALQKMQEKLKKATNGPLIGNHALSMPGINAMMIEGFGANENSIAQLQWVGALGKLVVAHAGGVRGGCENETALLNYAAAFLIGAEEYAYFGCGPWFVNTPTLDTSWHSFYDKPLGEPLGKAMKVDTVYSRKFKSGTSVTFDVHTNMGKINWSE